MAQQIEDKKHKYDRWVIVPFSTSAVATSLVAFSANGLVDRSSLYGSKNATSIVDATVLITGVLVLLTSWLVLWASTRSGNRH